MPASRHPACLKATAHFSQIECRTALGDAQETVAGLMRGKTALRMTPVLGEDGGEPVPLALRGSMRIGVPPRWWGDLKAFLQPLAGAGWGSRRQPVFLTSSNFGIDALYGLAKHRDRAYAEWATPQACARQIRQELGWGENLLIFSHACVSAQIGLYQAAQWLERDLADKALVLGFDYVGPFVAAGFSSLKILNAQMPAPFRHQETGSIGLGDGLAYAVLEKEGDGPRIEAQSLYNEMYHFTANEPTGDGFRKSLASIREGLSSDRFWIKGHGTGTIEAGRLEATLAQEVFPGHPLISWKGAIGHTLGSCALVETAIALAAHRSGVIPGTLGTSDPCFSPNVATSPFTSEPYDSVLLLSNAFGGAHAAMVVRYA